MNGKVAIREFLDIDEPRYSHSPLGCEDADQCNDRQVREHASTARSSLYLVQPELSAWSRSGAKRFFDCAGVLLALPLLIPALLAVAFLVRATSRGPVLFLQRRMGRRGRPFTIFKFRTMIHMEGAAHNAVTTAANQRFTSVGPFLRRWKLDELPQVANVLRGEMSLVGPRPKLPEHVIAEIPCRPGITGAASLVFACEETVLDRVPKDSLETYYHTIVLPAKRDLDAKYMAHATFFSDLRLIFNSVLRRWDSAGMESLLEHQAFSREPMPAQRTFGAQPAPARWNGALGLHPEATRAPVARRAETI